MNRKWPLRITIAALAIAVAGTFIDFYWEWAEEHPGDPPSSVWYSQQTIGFRGGNISLVAEDNWGEPESGFTFVFHKPIVRAPLTAGGWWGVWGFGIAPWFLALIVIGLLWVVCRLRKPTVSSTSRTRRR